MKALALTSLLLSQLIFSFSLKAETEEIKITDLQNNQMRAPASVEAGEAQMSADQLKAVKAQIEIIKENQKKSEEMMKKIEGDL